MSNKVLPIIKYLLYLYKITHMKKFDLIPLLIILSFVIVSFFTGCDEGKPSPKAPQSKRLELDSTSRY